MSRQSLPVNSARVPADIKTHKNQRESEMGATFSQRKPAEERRNQKKIIQDKSLQALAEAHIFPNDFQNDHKRKAVKVLEVKSSSKADGPHINEMVNYQADMAMPDREVSSKMKLPVIQMQDKSDLADNAALSNMCERPGGYVSHRPGRAPSYFGNRDNAFLKQRDAQSSRNNYI